MTDQTSQRRFLTVEQAAEELNVKSSLIRGLISSGELRALQVGGRGYLGQLANGERSCAGIPGRRSG
ncbi:excisionase family DNA-binding protein [Arthrobacter sp. NPDC093128]|uniref:excisionase family DNA-binding protein n=1 Tax=Arthrobacter sp. NPDC093128 TaxID=3154979 RepID=UPI00342E1688